MDPAIEILRGLHRGVRFLFENSIRNVVSDEQMKERIDGRGNSILWLIWHLARTEDAVVQTLIKGEPQILLGNGWQERLGVDVTNIGTGLGDDEVAELTKQLSFEAADAYWQATAKASYEWLKTIGPADLDVVPDLQARLEGVPPILAGSGNDALMSFWTGRSVNFLFSGPVISHGYIHLGQMQEIGGRLGRVGWF